MLFQNILWFKMVQNSRGAIMGLKLKGVIPAMVTLFNTNLEVNEEAMRAHVDYLIEGGVHGLLAVGSLGEFVHLTLEERKRIAEVVVDQTNSRVPVIIGVGSTSTRESVELARHAEDIGADALLLQAPYYFKYDEDTLYNHFKEVVGKSNLPLLIYNYPAAVGLNLSPQLIARLAEIENIIGLKDTTTDIGHIQKVIYLARKVKPDFVVFAGSDDLLLPNLIIGGDGAVTGVGNFWPSLPVNIYEAYERGNLEEARKFHDILIDLREFLFTLYKPLIPEFKAALYLMGRKATPYVRMPMQPLTKEKQEKLKEKLKELGLIK